jgi:transcriptional regulator with XRE-family HTH domain
MNKKNFVSRKNYTPGPLRMARLSMGLSMWQLYRSVGVSPSRLSLAERRFIELTEKEKHRMAKFFGLTTDELFPLEDVGGSCEPGMIQPPAR